MPNEKDLERRPFSWSARARSFVYAWQGIFRFFSTEHNAWIHLAASIVVALLAFIMKVSRAEAIVLVFAIALVWIAEMINTAIEKAMDLVSPQYDPRVKLIKDVAAGAVLIAAIAAVIAGAIIFIPKFFSL